MTPDVSTTAGDTLAVSPAAGVVPSPAPVAGPLVAIDLGIGDELDCEPDLRRLRAALEAAGLGEGMWITTHAVGVRPDRHAAIVVALPAAGEGPAAERRAFEAVCEALPDVLPGPRPGGHEEAAASGPGDAHGHSHAAHAPAIACGRLTRGERGPLAGAYEALAAREAGFGGRAVAFPGDTALVGEVTVSQVLDTAVDEVVDLARHEVGPHDRIATRDFVRPLLREGRWVLIVQPAIGRTYVPFEEPNPHRCCQDH